MDTMNGLEKTTYNQKVLPQVKEEIHSWIPFSDHIYTLFPVFSGESYYPAKYWVDHQFFVKVDIQLVLEGNLVITTEKGTHELEAGDAGIIFFAPHKLSTGSAGFCRKLNLGLQGMVAKLVHNQFGLPPVVVIHHFLTEEFQSQYDSLFEMLGHRHYDDIPEMSALAYSVLMYIISRCNVSELPNSLLFCRQYIEQNLATRITIESLCRIAGCRQTSLNSLFQRYFHLSPKAYVAQQRLEYGARLLAVDTLRIKEIATMCGYRSQLYFSNDFRRHFGMSPTCYRRQKEAQALYRE